MKNRDITMLCTRLLVLSTIWQMVELSSVNTTDSEDVQVAEACSLNITDFDEVQELFKEYTTERNVQLVDFRISGIEWSDSSNESIEVFDPNMLSWAAKKSEVLTQMPMDFSILSFGLSKLAMMDLEVSVVSFPTGCVQGLPFQHQRRLVMKEVLHLTNIGEDDEEENLICQHDYSRRIAGRVIGVGRSCCNRRDLRSGRVYTECKRDKKTLRMIKRFVQSFEAISVFGFLLPFFIIPCAVVWWQYNPLSFSDIFTEYMSNKLYKMSIFKLASRQQAVLGQSRANGTFHERDMVIGDDELKSYKTPVTIFTLLDINMRGVSCGKIKLTLLFIFQYVPVVAWLVQYSSMSNTLQLLDSAGKIVLNLHNNPYSWLSTDKSFSPFYIALMLIFLNFLLVVFVILWWLLEFETVRSHFATLLQLKANDEPSLRKSKETVKMVFKIFFVSLVVLSYIFVYSMFNCVIYAAGALIASNDIVAPWLTCAVLVIYYTKRSCSELTQTYTEIKRLVFKVCGKVKTYKATQIEKVEIEKFSENTLVLKNKTYNYKSEEFQGPVWFVTLKKKPDPTEGEMKRSSSDIPVPSATGPAESLPFPPERIEHQSNTGSQERTYQDTRKPRVAEPLSSLAASIGHHPNTGSQESIGHHPNTGRRERTYLDGKPIGPAESLPLLPECYMGHHSNAGSRERINQDGKPIGPAQSLPLLTESIRRQSKAGSHERTHQDGKPIGHAQSSPLLTESIRHQSNTAGSRESTGKQDLVSKALELENPNLPPEGCHQPTWLVWEALNGITQSSKGIEHQPYETSHESTENQDRISEMSVPFVSPPEVVGHRPNETSHERTENQDRISEVSVPFVLPPEVIGHRADASSNEGSGSNPDEKQGTGLLEIRMSKATLRGIYDLVDPIKDGLKMTAVKLLFILLFLALVGITMAAFRPDAVTVGAGVMASLSTLCLALIPRILELIAKSTDAESRLRADILEYNIRKLLYVNVPTFKVIEKDLPHSLLPTQFLQGTEQRNEMERSHIRRDNFSGEYNQICSELPYIYQHHSLVVPKLEMIDENASPNPSRPTRLPLGSGQKNEIEMKDITPDQTRPDHITSDVISQLPDWDGHMGLEPEGIAYRNLPSTWVFA